MGTLLGHISRWLIGKAGLLLVLIVTLLLVPLASKTLDIARNFDLSQVDQDVTKWSGELAPNKGAALQEIDQKLIILRELRTKKESKRDELKSQRCFLPTCTLLRDGDLYKVDLEIDFLTQAITYSESIRRGPGLCKAYQENAAQLQYLRPVDVELDKAKPPLAPVSPAHQKIKDEIVELEAKEQTLGNGCALYKKLASHFEGTKSQLHIKNHGPFVDELGKLTDAKNALWEAVKKVLPVAITTLAGIIFMPILVSALSYYGVAPIASRSFGVQLLQDSSGELSLVKKSDYEQEIDIDSNWELLIDPALVKEAPLSAKKKIRWLLDWSMPLSSLVSGLFLLTCIRSENKSVITISAAPAMANPSTQGFHANKIAVVDLPANAALVLQPRCLAGIVQQKGQPIKITRHWRIANLSSWLTLQLRYVVFHGPARLIVKGNDGINIGLARTGVAINQSSTLGYSANLRYNVSRSSPFYAYLSGKQQLFEDCFSSGPGFYIKEVTPKPMKGGPLGNPIPTIINTILKAFGLG